MIIEQNSCIYCGGEGELQREHVIPASYLGYRCDDSDKQWIVTGCKTCNLLAGSQVFFSIPEKAKYILSRYKVKYKKILSIPFWSETELMEIDYLLREQVKASVLAKAVLNVRIKFLIEVSEYAIDYLRPLWVEELMKEERLKQIEREKEIKRLKRLKKKTL
jgi:hypothetical protein